MIVVGSKVEFDNEELEQVEFEIGAPFKIASIATPAYVKDISSTDGIWETQNDEFKITIKYEEHKIRKIKNVLLFVKGLNGEYQNALYYFYVDANSDIVIILDSKINCRIIVESL